MSLTKSQQLMLDDGCPIELFLSREQRIAAWIANPPKIKSTREKTLMRWKISCYDSANDVIVWKNIEAGLLQVDVLKRMGEIYHRSQKRSMIVKIVATDAAGGLI